MKKILSGILGIFAVFSFAVVAHAATQTVVVTGDDLETSTDRAVAATRDNWFFYNDEGDTIDNTLGSFVTGPETPPEGEGSVQISVTGTQRRNLATYQFRGTPLDEITELKFSTYNPSVGNTGSVNRSGYLNFNVDFNGSDTWQRRLVFVPSVNGTVSQDEWQEWDALNSGNALWSYSGATWPVTGEPGTTEKTWSQILSDYPDARIRVTDSWLGIRVGEPYADGYTENIDAFKFGVNGDTTVFDFEAFYPVSGEITNPATDGETVSGDVNFTATYDDGDEANDDEVQWAVRQGSCSTNTVFGNVDGRSDTYEWDGASFSATTDTTDWTPGEYCFVFNPVDDPGQDNVRLTRTFTVEEVEEPLVGPPTSKDQCKNGGWEDFNNPSFRNQGQCIKYVNGNNGNNSNTSSSTVRVNQRNTSTVSNNVTVTQNTGGNKANRNTGNTTVTTGDNSSIIEIITRAARNIFIFR